MSSKLPSIEQARACLNNYEIWVTHQLCRTHWYADQSMLEHATRRADWIEARRTYLKEQLTAAVKREIENA